MDWQLKPLSRQSTFSGNSFETNEIVYCFIHKDPSGELIRSDIKADEIEAFTQDKVILGRWTRKVKEKNEEEKEAAAQTLKSAEDIFLSLYEEDSHEEEKNILKQILALFLERKRIIKRVKKTDKDTATYYHKASDRHFDVPMARLEPEQILKIEEQLRNIVI